MNKRLACLALAAILLTGCGAGGAKREQGVAAFATVQRVFQHPRCANCHVPGDAPGQFDAGTPHEMSVVRGPVGLGAPGLPCSTCHGIANPPDSYGPHAPPGAPNWRLPSPQQKMVFVDLTPGELCEAIKDPAKNGGRKLDAVFEHVAKDGLVLWGWKPGGARAPVDVPHDAFVAKFKEWMDAGAPCPGT